jgi:SPP1 gp7 family putative phage head morphogenesis protein
VPDPELLDRYAKIIRTAVDSARGPDDLGDESALEEDRVVMERAGALADQLERSILDAPWKRSRALRLVDEWVHADTETLSLADLSVALGELFSPARALLIARTETANVFNAALAGTLRSHGWNFVVWIASDDACPECAELNGSVIPIDEYEADPTLHPNCGCSAGPVEDPDAEEESSADLNDA